MSRTVSFRASEELDSFLEEEAERRMTTKSTVAQMLVAERVRQLQLGGADEDEIVEPPESEEVESEEEEADESEDNGEPAILEQHRDKWHTPDSQQGYKYAVRTAEGRLKYYKTSRHAANRMREEYGE